MANSRQPNRSTCLSAAVPSHRRPVRYIACSRDRRTRRGPYRSIPSTPRTQGGGRWYPPSIPVVCYAGATRKHACSKLFHTQTSNPTRAVARGDATDIAISALRYRLANSRRAATEVQLLDATNAKVGTSRPEEVLESGVRGGAVASK